MELSLRTSRIAAGVTLAIAAVLVLVGIWSFGIWAPWELATADIARRVSEGTPEEGVPGIPPLGPWLVAQGFSLLGFPGWSGRVPIAIAGLLTVLIAYWLVSRFSGGRAGVYAALVAATSPLFLFNSRHMLGAAPGFLASALVFTCAASLVFQPERAQGGGLARAPARIAWAVGLVLSLVLATLASGFLLGALPPLGAVAAVAIARGELRLERYAIDRVRWIVGLVLVAAAVVLGIHVALQVAADADSYSAWIGGTPRGGNPPTFEVGLEQIFHSFAPWSALLPIALGRALAGRAEAEPAVPAIHAEEPSLRLALAVWAAFGFAAQTVFVSRFGSATFLPVVALAGSVALLLRDVERTGRGSWAAGLVALLLSALLIRDFRGYPGSPASGLGLADLTLPEGFTGGRGGWAAVLGIFGLFAVLGLSVDREERTVGALVDDARAAWQRVMALSPGLRIVVGIVAALMGFVTVPLLVLGWPGKLLRAQWDRGGGVRRWLVFVALLATACTTFGILSFAFSDDRPYPILLVIAAACAVVAGLAWALLLGILLAGLPDADRAVRYVVLGLLTVLGFVAAPVTALGIALARRTGRTGSIERVTNILILIAVLATSLAIACGILGQEGVSSLVVRIGQALTFLVPVVVLVIGLGRLARAAFAVLGQWALAPMLLAAVIVGGYTSFRYQPLLSSHFSPREVYDAYNELAGDGEPLGEWRVGGRAAAYYARGEVREIDEQEQVLQFLASEERVWLAFRADDLAQLNRAYRQRANRHLFVADATSTSTLLATNLPIAGRDNQNYLADAVLDEIPTPQHPVGADFDHRIELVGYDLDLPNGRTVGPGQAFTVTWYWRALAPVPGNYQIFLHVDGAGQRLNGDHEPVAGRYPVRLWDEGDIVVDRQELRVPANFPPGTYTFFIGFYAGESRLDVVSGPADEVDRVRAGTLIVR